MKNVIRWAVRNSPAMNTLLIAGLALGAICALNLRREEFPEFDLEIILVSVPYPGASPDEVEQGIGQKIEEAVRSVDGIKKQTTVANEGACSVVLELESDIQDVQKVLSEVRSNVDRIPSLPELAEDPEIQQVTMRRRAIQVGVVGPESAINDPMAELQLRSIIEDIRNDMLQLPSVSQIELNGTRDYQIDVEVSEDTLRKHGLTLRQVAEVIKRENLELPGGNMKTPSEEVLLRGKNKRLTGDEIALIPLLTDSSGALITVGDIGSVKDDFSDTTAISRINGRPGLVAVVNAASREDLLLMTDEVRTYVKTKTLPAGYEFVVYGDQSVAVKDRLDLLTRNGLQGLILVFIVLAIFLEIRLAFWVSLGIPVSILGACCVLWYFGQTMNMLSMFSFLMALGIVVDDAIVIGENIYSHRQKGSSAMRAAVDGTYEVLPSVAASVTTTVIAFLPMMFVTGVMGKFFAVMPLAIIAMLVISLIESTFILPCHLAHPGGEPDDRWFLLTSRMHGFVAPLSAGTSLFLKLLLTPIVGLVDILIYPFRAMGKLSVHVNTGSARILEFVSTRLYQPVLRFGLKNPAIVISTSLALFIFSIGTVRSGMTPWVFFPKLDSNQISSKIVFPSGTSSTVTEAATRKMEESILAVNKRYEDKEGKPVVKLAHRLVGQMQTGGGGREGTATGGNVGQVEVELVDVGNRNVSSQQIIDEWRKESQEAAGGFPGAETVTFAARSMGPGGAAIEFKLLADATQMDQLEDAVEECKEELSRNQGVFDISDDSRPGKWEFQIQVRDEARSMGVPLADIAETVRGAYYGDEVMRLQRGRHEVKLMVRYPKEERQSLARFDQIRVRGDDGAERPITELAEVNVARGYAEINRINQKRSITVTADVDQTKKTGANASQILQGLQQDFFPKLAAKYPAVSVRVEGQAEQQQESVSSLFEGFGIAFLAMFVLLTVEFRSYVQPLIIMAVVPFGAIGAIWGHVLMDLPLTLFSVMGMIALTGVVVNDSIVLVDFINSQLQAGVPLQKALLASGLRRFRPVLLTSVTTVAGVLPILTETSLQAQLLIPMVTSLAFGLIVGTVLVLFLVPIFFSIYGRLFKVEERYRHEREVDQELGFEVAERPKTLAV